MAKKIIKWPNIDMRLIRDVMIYLGSLGAPYIGSYFMDDEMVRLENFDDAILGRGHRFGDKAVLVYDVEKCIDILIENSEPRMERDEAIEFFDFNVFGAYFGPGTPIFLTNPENDG